MLSRDKILKETSPLSIFFVKSGSSGNRLLFRYPYDESFYEEPGLNLTNEPTSEPDRLQIRNVIGESDEALCNMFSVNPTLCGQKFEIKINSVRHVGHPMSLLSFVHSPHNSVPQSTHQQGSQQQQQQQQQQPPSHRQPHHHHVNLSLSSYDRLTAPNSNHNINQGDITSFNIVCALRASASYDIVDCYHDLSKRLAIALSFEERRSLYLSKEIKNILATLEESDMANLAERDQREQLASLNKIHSNSIGQSQDTTNVTADKEGQSQPESVFNLILARSNLAKDFKRIFISLATSGIVDLKINNWVSVSFCLPQKAHRLKLISHKLMPAIGTKDIERCLLYLRPYHGLLLLKEPQELLDSLPIDASPAFIQLIRVTKPDKNFLDLSVDANLTLMQIFWIVSQLIYWAKATVIYPICDSNIYAIHPLATTGKNSKLVNDFKTRFPSSKSLHHYLANFSEGTSLSQLNGPLLNVEEKVNLLSIVTWLLQRRILTQIHKYIFLVVDKEPEHRLSNTAQMMNFSGQSTGYNDQNSSSPNGIEINLSSNNSSGNNTSNNNNNNNSNNSNNNNNNNNNNTSNNNIQGGLGGGTAVSGSIGGVGWSRFKNPSLVPSNSIDSSPQLNKGSFSESVDSSLRPYRTDSLPESQEDSNFGLNSSLSSTPNSNLEYPSPGNEANNRYSLSNSCPLDTPIGEANSIMSTLQQAGLSHTASRDILAIPSSKIPEDLKLLIRLIPYFDGKHHVEDIMFFENLERSQVLILCDKFRDILFTCHYEDVAVSQLSPFDSTK